MFLRTLHVLWVAPIIFILGARFWNPDGVFFNYDEGQLFNLVEEAFNAGIWPSKGLEGTKGLHYGFVPTWIYLALRHLVTDSSNLPKVSFFFNVALHTGTLIYLLLGARRIFSGRVFLILTGLILTSPYLFFYSKSIWDNIYLICLSNIFCGFLLRRLPVTTSISETKILLPPLQVKNLVFLGAILGLSLGVHFMSLPLVFAIIALVLLSQGSVARKSWGLALLLFVALLILQPYLIYLFSEEYRDAGVKGSFHLEKIFTGTRDVMVSWSGWVSWAEFFRYSIGKGYVEVISGGLGIGALWVGFMQIGVLMQFAWIVSFIIAVAANIWRWKELLRDARSRVIIILTGVVIAHFVMAIAKDATSHPHYFQAVWWVPFVLIGFWLDSKQCRDLQYPKVLSNVLVSGVGLNFVFLLIYTTVVWERQGFEGRHFGPSLELQRRVVREICANFKGKKELMFQSKDNAVALPALVWVVNSVKECQGLSVIPTDSGPRIQLVYAFADAEGLSWHFKN